MGIKTNEGKWFYRFATRRDKFATRGDKIATRGDNSPNDQVNQMKMGWEKIGFIRCHSKWNHSKIPLITLAKK